MLLFPHIFNTGISGQLFLEFLYVSPVYDFSNLKVIEEPIYFQWINAFSVLPFLSLLYLPPQRTNIEHLPASFAF